MQKEKKMTAEDVKIGDWFMINRTKKWYQKTTDGKTYVSATQIGNNKVHMIPNDEPVMVRK